MMYVSGHSIMSETGFRKTWKALLPFIVTARPMTQSSSSCVCLSDLETSRHSVEWPHMNHFYTGLVDNNHAHYYSTDNLNNNIGGVVASTGLNLLFGFRKAWKALLSFIVNDGRPLVDLSKEQHLHLQQCHLPTSLKLTIMSV